MNRVNRLEAFKCCFLSNNNSFCQPWLSKKGCCNWKTLEVCLSYGVYRFLSSRVGYPTSHKPCNHKSGNKQNHHPSVTTAIHLSWPPLHPSVMTVIHLSQKNKQKRECSITFCLILIEQCNTIIMTQPILLLKSDLQELNKTLQMFFTTTLHATRKVADKIW